MLFLVEDDSEKKAHGKKAQNKGKRNRFCSNGEVEESWRVGCQSHDHRRPSIVQGIDRMTEQR